MFCDVSGSTTLYRTLGDETAEALVRGTLGRMTELVAGEGGHVIKTIGDELMCRFATGEDAARAAIEMQRVVRLPVPGADGAEKLRLRIGFAAGSAVERDGDLFGDVVNIAARLAAMAKADQILTTSTTADAFDPELKDSTRLFDQTPVKGIKEVISVVQVLWERRNQTTLVVLQPSATSMSVKLELDYGGKTYSFTPKELPKRIGRGDDCDLLVRSESASRHHARIEYNRGKFMLVDESSNGTYVEVEEARGARRNMVYVRNEMFALVGSGRFALGARPADDPHVLAFRSF
ncbi:MAG: adenylate/guanylate cyclase domain-containing protein [Gammaproteobacteria bacterium]